MFVVIEIDYIPDVEFKFNNRDVKVTPYATTDVISKIVLSCLTYYREESFLGVPLSAIMASEAFDISVIDELTNLKVNSDNMPMDAVRASGLRDLIFEKIINISDIRRVVERSLDDYREYTLSLAKTLDTFREYLDSINPETVEDVAKSVNELLETVKDSKVSSLMDEV